MSHAFCVMNHCCCRWHLLAKHIAKFTYTENFSTTAERCSYTTRMKVSDSLETPWWLISCNIIIVYESYRLPTAYLFTFLYPRSEPKIHNIISPRKTMSHPFPHAPSQHPHAPLPPAHVERDGVWFHADLCGFCFRTEQQEDMIWFV